MSTIFFFNRWWQFRELFIYSLSFAVVLEYYKNMYYLYENNNSNKSIFWKKMISSHNSIPLYCAGYMFAFQLQNLLYFYYSKKCIDI